MTVMVNDCYEEKDQKAFHEGMKKLDDACKKMHGHSFMKATPEHRKELLVALDKERGEYQKTKTKEDPNHYFQAFKQLTIMGYFTSKEGREGATRYSLYRENILVILIIKKVIKLLPVLVNGRTI